MADNGSDIFNSDFLSFESTLDSLLEQDFPGNSVDDSSVEQVTPPLSEALMSTQLFDREDLGLNTGGNLKTAFQDQVTSVSIIGEVKSVEGDSLPPNTTQITMEKSSVTKETVSESGMPSSNNIKGDDGVDKKESKKSTTTKDLDKKSRIREIGDEDKRIPEVTVLKNNAKENENATIKVDIPVVSDMTSDAAKPVPGRVDLSISIQEKINLAELKEKRKKNLAQKRKPVNDTDETLGRKSKRRKEEGTVEEISRKIVNLEQNEKPRSDLKLTDSSSSIEESAKPKSSIKLNGNTCAEILPNDSEKSNDKNETSKPATDRKNSDELNTSTIKEISEKSGPNACKEKSLKDETQSPSSSLSSELTSKPDCDDLNSSIITSHAQSESEDMKVIDDKGAKPRSLQDAAAINAVSENDSAGSQIESRQNLGDDESSNSFFDEDDIDVIDTIDTENYSSDDTIVETVDEMDEDDLTKDSDLNTVDENDPMDTGDNDDNPSDINKDFDDAVEDSDGNNMDDNMGTSGDNDYDEDFEDSDLDDNEIYDWLEEGLKKEADGKKDAEQNSERTQQLKEGEFFSKEKVVLEGLKDNPFEVLPEGWIQIQHNSGMPVYLHKPSRVITLSKPYFIGTTGVRNHEILLSAIPCLHYVKTQEKEREEAQEASASDAESKVTKAADGTIIPTPVLKSAEKLVSLTPTEFHDYCKKLFKFKTVTVKQFKTWREKRVHLTEAKKKEKHLPGLPSDTKLITCTLPADGNKQTNQKKKDFVLNPVGKTPVCILHEYTQHVLRVQPTYVFKEIENAEKPFKASILINGIHYGSGVASAKRLAKAEAAKATLEMFMPWLADQWKDKETEANNRYRDEQNSDLSYFEKVVIDDPRVTDLCDKAALPKPVQVLHECLKRNFGMGDTSIHIEKRMISNQRTEFSLTVGKHTATVVCKNKREGKQRAAQAMLKLLHPHLNNWAAILRLYSKSNMLGFKEREEEAASSADQVTKMKSYEILDKLKDAMRKLKTQRESGPPVTPGNLHSTTQPIDL